ncbi:MAG: Exodeoxyribonuclease 7 small subunit [Chlamydiae bacterium]|nr:Exodeoxyribonuclease 7 small subunit [Chlamydiota bacterium]
MTKKQKFEEAFQRLEDILQHMNSTSIELEEALNLYQEADELIDHCAQKLKNAEQKIEILIKKQTQENTSFETKEFDKTDV